MADNADHPSAITSVLEALASDVRASVTCDQARCWFDGFWDYFVRNQALLDSSSTWEIQGVTDSLAWCLFFLHPAASADGTRGGMQFHVFVDVKSPPGRRAPWPVTTIQLEDGRPVGPTAEKPRPYDRQLAARMESYGFSVEIGHWGLHVAHHDGEAILGRGAGFVQDVLAKAIALARSVARAEGYLPGYDC